MREWRVCPPPTRHSFPLPLPPRARQRCGHTRGVRLWLQSEAQLGAVRSRRSASACCYRFMAGTTFTTTGTVAGPWLSPWSRNRTCSAYGRVQVQAAQGKAARAGLPPTARVVGASAPQTWMQNCASQCLRCLAPRRGRAHPRVTGWRRRRRLAQVARTAMRQPARW
ncbi:hypothetical protein T492DRAFT_80463 [Pavlovales sp. CCMP2436]|nr:hypothetical protein T492DRAFT_80463 [Pavlovales sp. CCMP2436]